MPAQQIDPSLCFDHPGVDPEQLGNIPVQTHQVMWFFERG